MTSSNIYPDFSSDGKPESAFKSALAFLWELVKVVVISLAIILPIRYFLVQPFYVKGASMEPNFEDHDYLLIDEISFRLREPQRGEVVVFHYPRDRRQFFIKRVVGLPGERVLVNGGQVWVGEGDNSPELLAEPYLSPGLVTNGQIDISLGEDEYYLLGDNRNSSLDSRSFGPVSQDDLVGRIWLRGWPFHRWAWYSSSATQALLNSNYANK